MIIETATPATRVVLTTFDVAPQAHASVLASLGATEQEFTAGRADFAGGAWLTRVAMAETSAKPVTERVVQYLQWDNGADARAPVADSTTVGHPVAPHRESAQVTIVGTQLY